MDSYFNKSFRTGLTGLTGYFFLPHFPEESIPKNKCNYQID
jgi:hypothetical protein